MLFNDHVAEVDAYAEPDPALFGRVVLTVNHSALDLHSAAHGIHDAREFGEQAVASVLYDPAAVLADRWINEFDEMSLEALVRALLVLAHQPRIPDHICGEDSGKSAG